MVIKIAILEISRLRQKIESNANGLRDGVNVPTVTKGRVCLPPRKYQEVSAMKRFAIALVCAAMVFAVAFGFTVYFRVE